MNGPRRSRSWTELSGPTVARTRTASRGSASHATQWLPRRRTRWVSAERAAMSAENPPVAVDAVPDASRSVGKTEAKTFSYV